MVLEKGHEDVFGGTGFLGGVGHQDLLPIQNIYIYTYYYSQGSKSSRLFVVESIPLGEALQGVVAIVAVPMIFTMIC